MFLSQKASSRLLFMLCLGTISGLAMTSGWRKTRAPSLEKRLGKLDE
jgi:hypothetical protein